MTTKQIINLDYRKEENQEIIQRVLRKIKPLSRYPDDCEIPFETLVKTIKVICKKYYIQLRDITPDFWSNNDQIIWRATLINETNYKVIEKIYGLTLYEVFAKATIQLYSEVKKGIEVRD